MLHGYNPSRTTLVWAESDDRGGWRRARPKEKADVEEASVEEELLGEKEKTDVEEASVEEELLGKIEKADVEEASVEELENGVADAKAAGAEKQPLLGAKEQTLLGAKESALGAEEGDLHSLLAELDLLKYVEVFASKKINCLADLAGVGESQLVVFGLKKPHARRLAKHPKVTAAHQPQRKASGSVPAADGFYRKGDTGTFETGQGKDGNECVIVWDKSGNNFRIEWPETGMHSDFALCE
eukprot:gene28561-66549_t